MSLEKITEKILSEAKAESDKILDAAKAEAEQISAGAEEKIREILEDVENRGQREREKIIDGRNSVINVDIRKLMLAKRQEVLRETFKMAGADFEENKRELQSEVAKILFGE